MRVVRAEAQRRGAISSHAKPRRRQDAMLAAKPPFSRTLALERGASGSEQRFRVFAASRETIFSAPPRLDVNQFRPVVPAFAGMAEKKREGAPA